VHCRLQTFGRPFLRSLAAVLLALLVGCAPEGDVDADGRRLSTTLSRVKSLDPAYAADVASALAVGHLYDRLLQYDYLARPYRVAPAMAAAPPEISRYGLTWTFRLRSDLYFTPDPVFGTDATGSREARRVRARDVVFSLLRIIDPRVHSPGAWIFRDYLQGVDEFREACLRCPPNDFSLYEKGMPGLHAPDEQTVVFRLTKPYPRLQYVLAMSYAGVVSERALRHYGDEIARHPVGSGPFILESWRRNYALRFRRNPEFRRETFPGSDMLLPRVDGITAWIVQEPMTAWLLFLQGRLDITGLTTDNYEAVVERGVALTPELRRRGIRLLRTPQFQINYVGFNHADPLLGRNAALRRAISLAYDVEARVRISNYRLIPANGPIPPGVDGYDPDLQNPWAGPDLERARRLLAEAGFPGGVDPATGRPLELHFDLGGTDLIRRRQAEMMVADMRKIGIRVVPELNNWPRFLQKLRRGDVQLFRVAWVADYPDGQNFLQLFYGPNAETCNRARYRNPEFDRLYRQAESMQPGPERTRLYQRMQRIVIEDCAWIFESWPISFRLVQPWVAGYIPHHFAFDHWKYVGIDSERKRSLVRQYRKWRFRSPRREERVEGVAGAPGEHPAPAQPSDKTATRRRLRAAPE